MRTKHTEIREEFDKLEESGNFRVAVLGKRLPLTLKVPLSPPFPTLDPDNPLPRHSPLLRVHP
jgi:hypothetical protein